MMARAIPGSSMDFEKFKILVHLILPRTRDIGLGLGGQHLGTVNRYSGIVCGAAGRLRDLPLSLYLVHMNCDEPTFGRMMVKTQ